MRVQPKAAISVVILVVYTAIVVLIWSFSDFDYETVGDTTSNIVKGIVVPVGIGAAFLAVAATWLGWWRPALTEENKAGPRWAVLLPVAMFIFVLLGVSGIDFGSDSAKVLPVLALGTALIGFSEEFMTRGLMLVGFRGSVSEVWVWFITSFLFGLLHGINVFFGQSVRDDRIPDGFRLRLGIGVLPGAPDHRTLGRGHGHPRTLGLRGHRSRRHRRSRPAGVQPFPLDHRHSHRRSSGQNPANFQGHTGDTTRLTRSTKLPVNSAQ